MRLVLRVAAIETTVQSPVLHTREMGSRRCNQVPLHVLRQRDAQLTPRRRGDRLAPPGEV